MMQLKLRSICYGIIGTSRRLHVCQLICKTMCDFGIVVFPHVNAGSLSGRVMIITILDCLAMFTTIQLKPLVLWLHYAKHLTC